MVKHKFYGKKQVCGRTENNDKGAVAIERACDSDIALDAIAISHQGNGWGRETAEYDQCNMRLRKSHRRNSIGAQTNGVNNVTAELRYCVGGIPITSEEDSFDGRRVY